jgi:light-regulated signal transduction histidine kinase (bacteriophytochrome)
MTDSTITQKPSDEIAPERLIEAGRAVADLAHLAKNIIQVLSGCSEIIDLSLKAGKPERVEKAWELFGPSFWRLKKFQLDLIKYTKSYPLTPGPCDVNKIILSVSKSLEPFFVKRGVNFSSRLAEGLPVLTADGEKLKDAVTNLVVTAVDNLGDCAGQVSIETKLTDSGDEICIVVCDSGPVLDTALCEALFTPYERCRNMLGSGLEIPLAKYIAEDHGGSLTINAAPCVNNTLEMRLGVSR